MKDILVGGINGGLFSEQWSAVVYGDATKKMGARCKLARQCTVVGWVLSGFECHTTAVSPLLLLPEREL